MMEATAVRQVEASLTREILFTKIPQTQPTCCAYSRIGRDISRWHGTSVISHKHGYVNLYKLPAEKYLTSTWKRQYQNISFDVSAQHEMEVVMMKAKKTSKGPDAMNIHVALAPPRRCPHKNASKTTRS